MTFKERISKEKDNLTKIFLYYDRGLFFNLVERSAYAFHTRVKQFKVHVKSLKGVDEPYVALGFPVNTKNTYLKGLSFEDDGKGCITVNLDEPINENAYQTWKKHIIEQHLYQKGMKLPTNPILQNLYDDGLTTHEDENSDSMVRQCLSEVQALNIAAMTPMEAMMFLNSLQVKLKNVKL